MEIELKFQVPAQARAGLRRAVATAGARTLRLQAVYADTPDRRLAAAGMALRLRKEGARWVQALKGRGDGVAERLEHEVPLAGRSAPRIDPTRHAGSAAGARLAAVLAGVELVEVLRTDIRRTWRRVRSGGAVIEIAHDRGELVAGGRRAPVDEVEFELVSGPAEALPALAARWASRHGLWWDVRSKAERGQRLARGEAPAAAVKAGPSPLQRGCDVRQAFATMVLDCLAHALPNAAEIAGETDAPEHLHQLRVALRRLRSVLREFAAWSGDAAAARQLEADWREPFAALGAARDVDALGASVLPRLRAAGAPPWPATPGATLEAAPAEVVRGAAVQRLLLRVLALALATTSAGEAESVPGTMPASARRGRSAAEPLARDAARVLKRAWRRALAGASEFEHTEPATQHRTRKRVKRLRYAFEFMVPLYRPRKARRLQRALASASEALGALNDLHVAAQAYEALTATEPRAWIAVGWLAGERERALAAAARRLRKLADAPQPWAARR